jgi:proline dehydrogenase
MEKIHQLFVLGIILKNKVEFTENINGVFVNMTLLDSSVREALQEYTQYVNIQQKQLDKVEDMKRHFKQKYYDKDNKEMTTY